MSAKVVVTKEHLQHIGEAIIAKGGASAPMKPSEMAEAIEAIPSGGGADPNEVLGMLSFASTKIDFTKIIPADGSYKILTTWMTAGQFVRNNKVVEELYAPNVLEPPSYFCGNCTNLKKVTVAGISNNSTTFTGCTSLEDITDISNSTTVLKARTGFLGSIPKTCVVHCTDKDLRYIDGAWTAVERS